jgi:hypothetical protein
MDGQLFMVFDVESVGLHGEGFAAAYVVIDRSGRELESGAYACNPRHAIGLADGLDWVEANVTDVHDSGLARDFGDGLGSPSPRAVRERFWERWVAWKEQGVLLAADCLWPVEARFLAACVDDDPIAREWSGPYPFIDVASVRLAAGLDPLETVGRLPRELPAHNPLADARQSARLLIEALDLIAGKRALGVTP